MFGLLLNSTKSRSNRISTKRHPIILTKSMAKIDCGSKREIDEWARGVFGVTFSLASGAAARADFSLVLCSVLPLRRSLD